MSRPVPLEMLPAPASRLDGLIEALLLALLAFAPLALGAVHAWSELVVVGLAGAAAVCLALRQMLRRDTPFAMSPAYVPLILLLLLAGGQLLPLPAGAVEAIAPGTYELKSELLSDLPDAPRVLGHLTLSFYPPATRQMLRILLAATLVLVVVANVYRRPEQIKRLLAGLAIIGGAAALLALAQDLSGATAIYWAIPLENRKATGGPFVNYNNFAQFMNLSIGAALALLLVMAEQTHARRRRSRVSELEPSRLPACVALGGVIVLGVLAIFLSGSRGGMLSFLVAFAVTSLALGLRRELSGRNWLMLGVGLVAFVALLYSGFDLAYSRLASLRDLERASGGRMQINRDVLGMLPRFWTVGIGLGAHELVYPMFSGLSDAAAAGHVENEYLQLIEELGVGGLVLGGLFLIAIAGNYLRVLRRGTLPIHHAAVGLGFGLIAALVHSATDFGQRLPANACLSAAFCGLLIALARSTRTEEPQPAGEPEPGFPAGSLWGPRLRACGGLAVVLLAVGWSVWGLTRSAIAESHWTQALAVERQLAQVDWLAGNDPYIELLTHAAAAAEAEPDNVHYRHWLNVYRWNAISRVRDEQTGQILLSEEALGHTRRIVQELLAARALCPTYGPNCCVAGQLQLFVLGQAEGETLIRAGYELAPTHPTACFVAGSLDARQGRFDESLARFRRAVLLGHPRSEAIDVYVRELERPDLALALAGDDFAALFQVADVLVKQEQTRPLALEARAEAVRRLKARCGRGDAPPWALARLGTVLMRQQDHAGAIEHLRQALARDYGNVAWRLELATALAKAGHVSQAMHEARVCLRLRPQMPEALRLLGELGALSGAGAEQ